MRVWGFLAVYNTGKHTEYACAVIAHLKYPLDSWGEDVTSIS